MATGPTNEEDTNGLLDEHRGLSTQHLQQLNQRLSPPQEGVVAADDQAGAIGDSSLQDIWKDPTEI